MRGLKQREGVPAKEADVSHLLQMRGLKQKLQARHYP